MHNTALPRTLSQATCDAGTNCDKAASRQNVSHSQHPSHVTGSTMSMSPSLYRHFICIFIRDQLGPISELVAGEVAGRLAEPLALHCRYFSHNPTLVTLPWPGLVSSPTTLPTLTVPTLSRIFTVGSTWLD